MSAFTPALIVEDDPAAAARMARLIEACCPGAAVSTAGTLAAAEALLARQPFRLALVDMHLPDGPGAALVGRMRSAYPEVQVVIVSSFGTKDLVLAAVRAGATGYLLKDADDDELLAALRSLGRGGAPMDPLVARKILALALAVSDAPSAEGVPADAQSSSRSAAGSSVVRHVEPESVTGLAPVLSRREQQVLERIAEGWTNREIAEALYLSTNTVESHAKSIYRKLAVGSRTQAVHEARRSGMLE